MKMRLLSLLVVAGALAVGPATAASADTGDSTSTRANGAVSVNLVDRDGRPPVQTFGRYWS
jgi:hypothetical protein